MAKRRIGLPVECLPFVKDQGPNRGLCFWDVETTGEYQADWRIGEDYALLYLEFLEMSRNSHPRLPLIVGDMGKRWDKASVGIAYGFFSIIGHMVQMNLNDRHHIGGWLARSRVHSDKAWAKLAEYRARERSESAKRGWRKRRAKKGGGK